MYGIKGDNLSNLNADIFVYDKGGGQLLKMTSANRNSSYSIPISQSQIEVDVMVKPNVSIQKTSASKARQTYAYAIYEDKMYVHAGSTSGTDSDLWEYNITNDTWTQKSPSSPPAARYLHAMCGDGAGKLYMFGGHSGSTWIDQLYEYDIGTNAWTYKGTSGTARMGHSIVYYDGNIYIYGGNNSSSLNTMRAYNIAGNSWSSKATGWVLSEHTAVVYNGKMYVFGGLLNGSSRINDIRSYTFSNNTWADITVSSSSRRPTARQGHVAVVIGSKMYTIGGSTAYETFNDVWSFDFITNTWQLVGVLANDKWRGGAVPYNNKIYLHAGYDGLSQASTTYEIDPTSAINSHSKYYKNVRLEHVDSSVTFTTIPTPTPTSRYDHTVAMYNDKLYIYGGHTPSISSEMLEYNTSTNVTTAKTSGIAAYHTASVAVNNKVYVYGGLSGSGVTLSDMRYFDIINNSWTTKTTGLPRWLPTMVVYGNKLYTFGGVNGAPQSTLYEYDITNDSWSQKASGPPARYGHTAQVYGSKMYIFGGLDQNSVAISDLWVYDLINNTWEQKANNTVSLSGTTSFVYNNILYVLYGSSTSGYNRIVYKYDFTNNTWSNLGTNSCLAQSTTVGALATNGNFYTFCGYNGGYITSVYIYTP